MSNQLMIKYIHNNIMRVSAIFLIALALLISSTLQQQCDDSEYFNGQRCAPCKANCRCSSQNQCSSCMSGYTFDSKYENCVACPTAIDSVNVGCKECCYQIVETSFVCSKCDSGGDIFMRGGQCIKMQGCSKLTSSGRCQSCSDGYFLRDGACQTCDPSCETCADDTFCSTCAVGYFNGTDGHFGLCDACSAGCSVCTDSSTCTTCSTGYKISGSACVTCGSNCASCSTTNCLQCDTGYTLIAGNCYACTDAGQGGTPGCLTCQTVSNSIQCLSCDDGYYLAGNGACYTCNSQFSNSALCVQSKPLQCVNDDDATLVNRYYLVGNSCVANAKQCKTMKNSAGDCSSCYFEEGYYYQLQGTTCSQCVKPGCKTFSRSCRCLSCLDGYQYVNSQCVACQNLHCITCQDNVNTCEECAPYYGIISFACISCTQSMCLNCDGDNTACVLCQDGYYNSDGICYQCQDSCEVCESSTKCTSCASGYYLHSSGRCKALPSNCVEVSSYGNCVKCEYGYMQSSGTCFPCSPSLFNLHQCERFCPSYYALLVWEGTLTLMSFLGLLMGFLAMML